MKSSYKEYFKDKPEQMLGLMCMLVQTNKGQRFYEWMLRLGSEEQVRMVAELAAMALHDVAMSEGDGE